MPALLTVVGVRHHSPACARLVQAVMERLRPRYVLIEGPSDMNERLDELRAAHRLPIALFSYSQHAESGVSRGMWTPFCDYSPEWVALHTAQRVGATPLFIDLPAWDKVFEGEENRYSDRHANVSDRLGEMCARLGFEGTDALWDHLFEAPQPGLEVLETSLGAYFAALRGDEHGGERNARREDFMARHIAWAAAQCGGDDAHIVVVCGGYHKPALERLWQRVPAERPECAPAAELRVGSYLVPFSFKRLDSFQGYASGMPSPAFYQKVWDAGLEGAEDAAEAMLFLAIRGLRAAKQRVSVADAIAARTLAHGLASMRGRDTLRRIDVLDGLAGALVKDALEVPLPWTQRGPLPPRTDPLLVELVAIFSGEGIGELAKGTPRPPLVDDVMAELSRTAIPFEWATTPGAHRLRCDLTTPRGIDQSQVLHRLRILGIPGFTRTRAPSFSRQRTDLTEEWSVVRLLETDTALIEAALYGALLVTAASARLEERTRDAAALGVLADALVDGVHAGIAALTHRWLWAIRALVATEASLGELGGALARLVSLGRGEGLVSARTGVPGMQRDLSEVIGACYDRGLWLFEGVTGPTAEFSNDDVEAVRALRDAARHHASSGLVDVTRGRAVCERRAVDPEAPPALRGAALGFLWSVDDGDATAEVPQEPARDDANRAVLALRGASRPETIGDFLAGLFALARGELLSRERALLTAIDEMVSSLGEHDFFVALPALRQAFAYFPPRERLAIAERLVGPGVDGLAVDPMTLLSTTADADTVIRGVALEERALALAARFGLSTDTRKTP